MRLHFVLVEESALTLEEMYTALMARFHHSNDRNGQSRSSQGELARMGEKGER